MSYVVDSDCLIKNNIKNFIIVNDHEINIRNKIVKSYDCMVMHTHLFENMESIRKLFKRFSLMYVYVDNPRYRNDGYQLSYRAIYDENDNLQYMWKHFTSG